ncbi:hypothetical protein [Staphylococcus edaphicus]|uniref:Uncharacterized protein n=1 Tax=Staphylococcus edaphicus TaxID=1955013 RepID=A0ABY4QFD0_9STAP|nr:hypothetical protein [Staphylococcus edaphicus]UQW82470.1 hypothetical protein MNY58_05245 [Staphylococcus edaphicus]
MKEIESKLFEKDQQLFVIHREEIESYLEDEEFDGFIIHSNIEENKVEIYKKKLRKC